MNLIPNPLHPAVVHFPIVLILLGAAAAILALFWRRNPLPWLAAVLLSLGALATWAAVESGESDGGLLENSAPQVQRLVDTHETWAKRTLALSLAAAVAASGAALSRRWPRVALLTALVAALVSATAAYGVYQTGHHGGALVYQHGAGVGIAANVSPAPAVGRGEEP